MKKTFYSEAAYLLALFILPFGAAMIRTSGLGLSMVIAPAFLISEKVPFMSFGMAEYTFQALLLFVFCVVVRRFRPKYLISFLTSFLYGCILDLYLMFLGSPEAYSLAVRVLFFILGDICTITGVVFFFKTYIPPEVYELFVQGISDRFKLNMGRVKWIYDLSSLALSVALSFAFFGALRGVGVGTLVCAVINGPIISVFSRSLDREFSFRPAFSVPAWLK